MWGLNKEFGFPSTNVHVMCSLHGQVIVPYSNSSNLVKNNYIAKLDNITELRLLHTHTYTYNTHIPTHTTHVHTHNSSEYITMQAFNISHFMYRHTAIIGLSLPCRRGWDGVTTDCSPPVVCWGGFAVPTNWPPTCKVPEGGTTPVESNHEIKLTWLWARKKICHILWLTQVNLFSSLTN